VITETFSFPAKMREEYFKQWHAEHDPPLGKEPVNEDVAYKGHDWDDVRPRLQTFFGCDLGSQLVSATISPENPYDYGPSFRHQM